MTRTNLIALGGAAAVCILLGTKTFSAEGELPCEAQGTDAPLEVTAPVLIQAGMEASLENQILIRFDNSLTLAEIDNIIRRIGAREISRMMDGTLYLVEIPYANVRADLVTALSATRGVLYAEPNLQVSIPTPPEGGNEPPKDGGDASVIPLPIVE